MKYPVIYPPRHIHIPESRPLPKDRLKRGGAVVDQIYPETTREILKQLKLSGIGDTDFFITR